MSQPFGQISTKYRSEKSFNGFKLSVLKSALQKYIRRCMPEKAIYAGAELDLFSLDKDGERLRTNLIHRLMIIYMEDVFNPGLWTWMNKMIFDLIKLREKRKNEEILSKNFCEVRKKEMNIVSRIIYALSQSFHSRENSYYKFCYRVYFQLTPSIKDRILSRFPFFKEIEKRSIIEYTPSKPFSLFEKKDRELHQLCNQFLGSLEKGDDISVYFAYKIIDYGKIPEKFYRSQKPEFLIFFLLEFITKQDKFKKYKELPSIGVDWFKELSPIKEDFLTWQNIILIFLKGKTLLQYEEEERYLEEAYRKNIDGIIERFDDFVYDMHTEEGRKLGKGSKHFATESSKVCNEFPDINKNYKDAYTYYKIISEGGSIEEEEEEKEIINEEEEEEKEIIDEEEEEEWMIEGPLSKKESDFSRFLLRAQLVTGNSKADTYFGEKDGKVIFIKGPFESLETIKDFMKIQEIKKELGLSTLNYRVVLLKPDLFQDVPLSIRNTKKIDRKKEYPFLVSDVLFDYNPDKIPYQLRKSEKWPETKVVDWDKVEKDEHMSHLHPERFTEMLNFKDATRDFVENIIFRYIFGIGDLAGRNFIVKDGNIYSIDEDSFDRDFNLETNLGKRYNIVIDFMKKYPKYFRKVLVKYLKYAPYKHKGYKRLEMSKEAANRMGKLYELVKI